MKQVKRYCMKKTMSEEGQEFKVKEEFKRQEKKKKGKMSGDCAPYHVYPTESKASS